MTDPEKYSSPVNPALQERHEIAELMRWGEEHGLVIEAGSFTEESMYDRGPDERSWGLVLTKAEFDEMLAAYNRAAKEAHLASGYAAQLYVPQVMVPWDMMIEHPLTGWGTDPKSAVAASLDARG